MNILEKNKVAILNTDPEKTRAFFERYKANNRIMFTYKRIGWFYFVINGSVSLGPYLPIGYTRAEFDWQPPNEEELNKKLSALIAEANACGLSLEGGRFVKK